MGERTGEERRSAPRVDCKGEQSWRMALQVPLRLIDLAEGGALLASNVELPLAADAQLRIRLAGRPFEARVNLVRDAKRETPFDGMPYEVAAVFVSMDERSRDVMTRFLRSPGGVRQTS